MSFLERKLAEMCVLLKAMDRSLADGRRWLESRLVPNGRVTRARNFSFFGKPLWGLWSAGASQAVIKKLLDHAAAEALQPNGSKTCIWFTPEEMSGEFLGEMAVAREGVKALMAGCQSPQLMRRTPFAN